MKNSFAIAITHKRVSKTDMTLIFTECPTWELGFMECFHMFPTDESGCCSYTVCENIVVMLHTCFSFVGLEF